MVVSLDLLQPRRKTARAMIGKSRNIIMFQNLFRRISSDADRKGKQNRPVQTLIQESAAAIGSERRTGARRSGISGCHIFQSLSWSRSTRVDKRGVVQKR